MNFSKIEASFNESELFKALNSKCQDICEKYGATLTEEEYRALRNLIVCKTMLEDEKVFKSASESVFEELKQNNR